MDEIINMSYDAVARYFTHLSQFGYRAYGDVEKLLALLCLEDILNIFGEYVSEDDFRSIVNSIYCLCGSTCLIKYPEYINDDTLFHQNKIGFIARVSLDNNLRSTEDYKLRVKA